MFSRLTIIFLIAAIAVFNACSAPKKAPKEVKDGIYPGRGKITKIDKNLGSVELDHDAIEGVMPAMKMEFMVRDKPDLDKVAVGEDVRFMLEYRGGKETILTLGK
jgi:Cu/Ag efflux protein CusF